MRDLFDLTGKVALLTGASKGMGLAMATALADHGATVVISSRKIDQLEAAAAQINEKTGAKRAIPVACNIGYKDQLASLVAKAHELAGPIDIVVGNAAVNPHFGRMDSLPDEAFDKIMNVNVKTNHWLAQMVGPEMAERGEGSMIFTSSIGAFKPSLEIGAYNISKVALLGLVRNIAAEFGPSGVRANAVCPGLIKTEFAKALYEDPKREKAAAAMTAMKRLGDAEDFRGIAVFLAAKASEYMTGQALTVDGGTIMWT